MIRVNLRATDAYSFYVQKQLMFTKLFLINVRNYLKIQHARRG